MGGHLGNTRGVFRHHARADQVIHRVQLGGQMPGQFSCGFVTVSTNPIAPPFAPLDISDAMRFCHPMKQLLRTNDPTIIAFAQALLQGEGIDCFEMDVNMSILEGSIGVFPRRLMVADAQYDRAVVTLRDNGVDVDG